MIAEVRFKNVGIPRCDKLIYMKGRFGIKVFRIEVVIAWRAVFVYLFGIVKGYFLSALFFEADLRVARHIDTEIGKISALCFYNAFWLYALCFTDRLTKGGHEFCGDIFFFNGVLPCAVVKPCRHPAVVLFSHIPILAAADMIVINMRTIKTAFPAVIAYKRGGFSHRKMQNKLRRIPPECLVIIPRGSKRLV